MTDPTTPLELLMYARSTGCPFVTLARRVLDDYGIEYRELHIDRDDAARARVLAWTGFLSVPTLVVTRPGEVEPIAEPAPLERGFSPRGIDRGPMITEPGRDELIRWLMRYGFVDPLSDG